MDELLKWLSDNYEHFTTYSDQEIIDVAVASGFDRNLVTQALIHKKFKGWAA